MAPFVWWVAAKQQRPQGDSTCKHMHNQCYVVLLASKMNRWWPRPMSMEPRLDTLTACLACALHAPHLLGIRPPAVVAEYNMACWLSFQFMQLLNKQSGSGLA